MVVDREEVRGVFGEVVDELVNELPDMIADSFQAANRKLALTTAMKMAREFLKVEIGKGVRAQDLVSGKTAISRISAEAQTRWNVQISPMALCRHLAFDRIPAELKVAVHNLV